MSIQIIALIIVTFINLSLAGLVFFKNKKNIVNISYACFVLSVSLWALTNAWFQKTASLEKAFILAIVSYLAGAFIASSLLVFSFVFLGKKSILSKQFEKLKYPIIALTIFIAIFVSIPGVVLEKIAIAPDSKPLITTSGLYLYALVLMIFLFWALFNLFKSYKISVGVKREQLKLVFLGLSTSIAAGLFFNLILPLMGIYRYVWLGPDFSIFFVVFTGYSIIKYRLMDIRIVLRKSFVYIAALTTVVSIGTVLMVFDMKYLDTYVPALVAGPILLIFGIVAFGPIRSLYLRIANKYFFTSLYNYQNTIEKLTKRLTTIIEIDKVIDLIIDTIIKTMKLDRAGMLLRTESGEEKRYYVARVKGFHKDNGISLMSDEPLAKFMEKSKKLIVRDELQRKIEAASSKSYIRKMKGVVLSMESIKAAVCLPLVSKQRLIGFIVLGDKISKEAYTKEDLDLLSTLASQASVAIENAILYKEVQKFSATLQERVDEQTKEMKDLYEMKSNFLTVASHQLRTPASIIRGMLSMMVEDDFSEEKKSEMIDAAFKSSGSLERVIEDILTAAEIDSAKFDFDPEPVDILPIIERIIEDLSLKAEKKGIKIEFAKSKEKEMRALTNITKIEQAFANLIDNAIKYTPKGKVEISVFKEKKDGKEFVVFSCKDNGIGMTEKDLRKIGEKFFRSKNVFAVSPSGTGLGIYIVKRIVKASRGKLEISSEGVDKGSEFRVVLKAV